MKTIPLLLFIMMTTGCFKGALKECRSRVLDTEKLCTELAESDRKHRKSPEFAFGRAMLGLENKDREQAITSFVEVIWKHPSSPLAVASLRELKKLAIPDVEYKKLEARIKDAQ